MESGGAPGVEAPELVGQRESCELLGSRCGLDRETATRVLKAGLAGEPVRLRGSLLYRRELVQAVGERPLLGPWLPQICQQGTFVARLTAASGPWRLSTLGRVKLRAMIGDRGFVPFVATTGGFVVLGAEIEELGPAPGQRSTLLALRPAGAWFDAWRGGRLPTGPGGPWQMWPAGLWQLASRS